MKFGFREPNTIYVSASQRARIWTEQWVSEWLYCPNCGNPEVLQFPANLPLADFYCPRCNDQYELKSQKKPFGAMLANGAYSTKMERLKSASNPNLLLLNYDASKAAVTDLCIIPKHFFVPEIVEQRKPLAATARRAGWVGSNILLSRVPQTGRIHLVKNSIAIPQVHVLAQWKQTIFLRGQPAEMRGWLIEVMKCVDMFGDREFEINEIYEFAPMLARRYPDNNNVKPKIRQQLQVLRDSGYLKFVSRGRYRRIQPIIL
ncbi:DpnI domain-containing protein [Mesorhizobium yinganensis]|uniref:DpnI domain-containing protein n=1 Tax=Mesorhizobium yinganensis TaxID=3157707 RepID=UPI0032B7F1FB